MDDTLKNAAEAIKQGNKARARSILKTTLKENPTADAWVMAAKAMETDEQALTCIKKAIALDEWHTEANRMLLKLEKTKSILERERPLETQEVSAVDLPLKPITEIKRQGKQMAYQRHETTRKLRNRLGCVFMILLATSCTGFTFGAIGVIPGVIGSMTQLMGGPPPINEVDGVRIEQIVDNPAATVPASQSKPATSRGVDVLDNGYNHEYTFQGRMGEEVLGYVQFMSLRASAVPENVAIIDPNGNVANNTECEFYGEDGLLGGEGNVTFSCMIQTPGTWKVHVLGINGESVGAYFIGVSTLSG